MFFISSQKNKLFAVIHLTDCVPVESCRIFRLNLRRMFETPPAVRFNKEAISEGDKIMPNKSSISYSNTKYMGVIPSFY